MPVAEMLARVSSSELTAWIAYERVTGPLGPARADLQAGIVASTVANANRSKGRRAVPADFIPTWDRKPAMDWRQQLATVKTLNRAMRGADVRKGAPGGDHLEPAGAARRR